MLAEQRGSYVPDLVEVLFLGLEDFGQGARFLVPVDQELDLMWYAIARDSWKKGD